MEVRARDGYNEYQDLEMEFNKKLAASNMDWIPRYITSQMGDPNLLETPSELDQELPGQDLARGLGYCFGRPWSLGSQVIFLIDIDNGIG
jgi:hypothetical protein